MKLKVTSKFILQLITILFSAYVLAAFSAALLESIGTQTDGEAKKWVESTYPNGDNPSNFICREGFNKMLTSCGFGELIIEFLSSFLLALLVGFLLLAYEPLVSIPFFILHIFIVFAAWLIIKKIKKQNDTHIRDSSIIRNHLWKFVKTKYTSSVSAAWPWAPWL